MHGPALVIAEATVRAVAAVAAPALQALIGNPLVLFDLSWMLQLLLADSGTS